MGHAPVAARTLAWLSHTGLSNKTIAKEMVQYFAKELANERRTRINSTLSGTSNPSKPSASKADIGDVPGAPSAHTNK